MQKGKLVVLGSINVDHIVSVDTFPRPGETVSGHRYQTAFGGKGANQAVAAGRSGADITFIACVGSDDVGEQTRQQLSQDNIDMHLVESVTGEKTGIAMIMVDHQGENMIAIAPGANTCLTPELLQKQSQAITSASALLMQLETPLETVEQAAELAKQHGVSVILNPAPARPLSDKLLSCVTMITPNETEAEALTGISVRDEESAAQAAQKLHQQGIERVLITLGKCGAWVSEQGEGELIAGFTVKAIDTTAAGDTFNGALMTALLEQQPLKSAVRFAHAAAAIAVTRMGAQPSVPWRREIEHFLQQQEC